MSPWPAEFKDLTYTIIMARIVVAIYTLVMYSTQAFNQQGLDLCQSSKEAINHFEI